MKEIIEVLRHFRVKYYSLSITYTFKDPFNTEYVLEVGCDGITFKKLCLNKCSINAAFAYYIMWKLHFDKM